MLLEGMIIAILVLALIAVIRGICRKDAGMFAEIAEDVEAFARRPVTASRGAREFGLSFALLLTAFGGSVAAQQSGTFEATMQPAIECTGQYDCVDNRPLMLLEAQASYAFPRDVQPAEIAETEPAARPTARAERREAKAAPQ